MISSSAFVLPALIQHRVEKAAQALLISDHGSFIDFKSPVGAQALQACDSVSWRVFKNPVALYIGGVAAVILELAEPRVRTGVWEKSNFRTDPVRRLRRTGLAAMVTVYGPRETAEAMIAGIRRRHENVRGVTPDGETYCANDPDLLNWVHATAAFGFLQASHVYVKNIPQEERDRYYAEGRRTATPYGATNTPVSEAALEALFERMRGRLEPSPIVREFLDIMRRAPLLPRFLRPAQKLFVGAAIEIIPSWIREMLNLEPMRLSRVELRIVRRAGSLADRIILNNSPAVQACQRLGLPRDYLFSGDVQ